MDKPFEKLWSYAVRGEDLPMEIRLFRLVSLTAALLCGFLILPTNLLQDLSPYVNIILGMYTLVCTFLYDRSTRGRHYVKSFYLATILVLNAGWFLNAGSSGSIGYFFFATVLLPLIFFRGKTRQVMFLLLVIDYCLLLMVEHWYPASVIPYKSVDDRLLDLTAGFAFSALAVALFFWVVVTSLERELEERRRAQRSLAENEATLRMLMDSMPSGIWWFSDQGRIEYLNLCFRELFGYRIEDIPTLGAWFERAYPDEAYRRGYLAARDAAIAEARREGTAVPVRESRITCRDGSVKHVIINTQFALGRTLEIFTDITERELLQEQMLKVEKLESLGVLAGGIAHDFNNILTSVLGNISFAKALVGPGHQCHEPLNQAELGSLRAAQLARQLLTFSKGGQPVKGPVDVAQLLEESLALSTSGTNVQTLLALSPQLRPVDADEGQLSQAFNNLIINAVHAMPHGGTLTVGGGNVTLREHNAWGLAPGEYIRLTFADQGEGIAEADQRHIFDPYFSTKSGGTGLGLASTHSIVTRHGGHIALLPSTSGAVFAVHLPALERGVAAAPRTVDPKAPERGGGEAILVMDDDEMIRVLASRVLMQSGYLVQSCADGADAVALYRSARERGFPYAVVIVDLTVPGGMGGKEAAQEILALDRQARIIMSTGYSTELSIAEWSWYGFSAFLPKPYAAPELLRCVAAVLQKRN